MQLHHHHIFTCLSHNVINPPVICAGVSAHQEDSLLCARMHAAETWHCWLKLGVVAVEF